MKKISVLLGLAAILATSSCEDYLNTKPNDKIGLEQYYTDEAAVTSVLYGVYDILGSNIYNGGLWRNLEMCTDEAFYLGSYTTSGPQVYIYDSSNSEVASLWSGLYIGIERANELIANINVVKMDETNRQMILGEALFLRGYYYFILTSRFGDVPLRLVPTTSPYGVKMAKSSTADIYAQVLKDMKEAEGMVRQTKWVGHSARISKTVVQGILTRVYLQMAGYPLNDTSKYSDALAYSKKVIDSGERGLNISFSTDPFYNSFNESLPSVPANSNNAYRQIFINQALQGVVDTREDIWEVEFKGNQTDGYSERGALGAANGLIFSNTAYSADVGYGYGFHKSTGRLFNKYDASGLDLRRDWNLTTYTLGVTNNVVVRNPIAKTQPYGRDAAKWRREYEDIKPKAKNDSQINFPVLRYADVLLMFAEAENQVNGPTAAAAEAVNKVRRRGYGRTNIDTAYPISDNATATAVASGKAAFQLFIEDERMRELCFEGVRKMDLVRWDKFITTMKSVSSEIRTQTINPSNQYGALGGESVQTKHLLFPIPAVEMTNNISIKENNPGW